MKLLIPIIFFLLSFSAKATNRHFSTLGNDVTGNGTINNPYRTITKLNSLFSSFSPGDSILFKRGEIFYGSILISRSGTALLPIVLGSYGTGPKAKIIGLVSMSTFTQSGNIWTSAANSLLTSETRVVLDDGVQLSVGRYPNLNTSNAGYLMYESATTNSITDNQLSTTPINWTGATVAYKWSTYHIKKAVVESHANTRLNFVSSSTPVSTRAGYFFTNDRRTLDLTGEYYINPSKQIAIYNVGVPTGIQASAIPSLIKSVSFSYIHITDLNLVGANSYGISIGDGTSSGGGGTGFLIKNCDISYSGERGIYANNHSNLTIRDLSVSNSLDVGMYINNCPNFIITKNSIKDSYTIAGMGGENLWGGGIHIPVATKGRIDSNLIVNSGLNGIRFDGDSIEIKYNTIDGYCLVKNDGGGIYKAPPNGGIIQRHGCKLIGNIILNGGDATAGTIYTMTLAYAVYGDVSESNLLVQGNSMSGGDGGIFFHRGINNIIRDNTVFNFNKGFFIAADISNATAAGNGSTTELVRGITVKNNIFFAATSTDRPIYYYAVNNDVRLFGTIDSNYICRPSLEPNNINNAPTAASGGTINVYTGVNSFYSLIPSWQNAYYPHDANSKKSPKGNDILRFEANSSYRDSVVILNDPTNGLPYTYLTARGVRVKGTVTLAPYTSLIMIRDTVVPSVVPNAPPTVSLTSPANGSSYVSPASISLAATASDADGTISTVRFYSGGTLLSSDATSPYTLSLINVPAGGYSFTAHAIDNDGDSTISAARTSTVSDPPPANMPPVVSVTAPLNGATYTAPGSITLTATASDADGSISQVQFYQGATLVNTQSTSPYTYNWTGVAAGTYNITAKATDNSGAVTTSGIIQIVVQSSTPINVPPTVSLTSPANGQSLGEPADIDLAADAGDTDGTVAGVSFYNGATLLGVDVDSPYVYLWSGVPAGNYNLTAKATDNSGATTTSAIASITVVANIPPTISITSPADNSSFTTPADVTINADAADADGNVTVVNFYEGSTWIGSDSTAPYTFYILGYTTGSYILYARAVDNSVDSTTSAGIVITVGPVAPLAANSDVGVILCNGGSTIITIGATGGTAPYTGTGSNVVTAGTYTYIVEDFDGTKDTVVVTVSQPAVLSLTDSIGAIGNYNGSTEAHIFPTGGTAPYEYQINNGVWQSSNVFVIIAGGYLVNVRDANGCTDSIFFSVTQPAGGSSFSIQNAGKHYNK